MRFKLILIAVLCTAMTQLHAQMQIKPAVGINFTDFSKDEAGDVKGRVGWQIGGSVAFGKQFYFEPGLFYVGKSSEITDPGSSDKIEAGINGIRVPVAVGINLLGTEKTLMSVRGFGGVSGFFLTSVSDDIDKEEINGTSWGVFAGAGLDISIVFAEVSYEWSLTNIQKDITQVDVGKLRSLYISAGIRLAL